MENKKEKKKKSPIIPIILILIIATSLFLLNKSRQRKEEESIMQKINNAEMPEEFEGVGMMLSEREGIVTVVKIVDDSPAETAGLHIGDRIIKIDQKETKEMNLSQVQDKIRGRSGSQVTLTIARQGDSPEITEEIIVTRGEIFSEGSEE